MAKQNAINNFTSQLTVDPGASGDSFVQFDINATGEFRIGVDDTDDSFRISQGSVLGTNDTFVVSAAGEITKPLQPAFLVYMSADANNVTGDGSNYTVAFNTEAFDQNSDFNTGTYTFTAPVTGIYRLEENVTLGGLAAANTNGGNYINTSNHTYLCQANPGGSRNSSNQFSWYSTVFTDMDAADTSSITLNVTGGTLVVDVIAGTIDTWFSGNLEV